MKNEPSSVIHVRIDNRIKTQATDVLSSMGLSISDAVRTMLVRVVAEKRLPFELKAPNTATKLAMTEADEIIKMHNPHCADIDSLSDDIEDDEKKKHALNVSIDMYIDNNSKFG